MLRIHTPYYRGDTQAILLRHLRIHDEEEYEIVFLRTRTFEGELAVSMDFLLAAYAGHMLAETSSSFSYYIPSPKTTLPFLFCVTTRDKKKLARVLRRTIKGYYRQGSYNVNQRFIDRACLFEDDVNQRAIPCYTMGLLAVSSQTDKSKAND